MTNVRYQIFLLFVAIFLSLSSTATHLIGGNIGYESLGATSGVPNSTDYRIYLETYMDCNSQFWDPTTGAIPGNSVNVGIYEGTLSSNSGIYFTDVNLGRTVIDTNITPNLPPNCSQFLNLVSNACIALVRFETIVSLPNNNLGYHIIYDRCCRPGGVVNLTNSGDQSFSFTTWIPGLGANVLTNSSPVYFDTLVSYICANDTGYIQNLASDPDGDSLVYSLVSPFVGVSTDSDPVPSYGAVNPYPIPNNNVVWATGFGPNNYFGNTGYQSIDSQTGTAKFFAATVGIFTAAIEIREYRNGILLSFIRRNLQLYVDNCPNNSGPVQDINNLDTLAVTPTIYEAEEGQSFCINLDYDDADGDALAGNASGLIFNSAIVNPPATITFNASGASLTSNFCWNTTCSQGSTTPYNFVLTTSDTGACPPIPITQNIQINLTPFTGPTSINGPDTLCQFSGSQSYSVSPISGATYSWTVSGGVIISGGNSSTVNVDWGSSTTGQIEINTTSQYGCPGNPLTKTIVVSEVVANAGPDISICNSLPTQIGGSPTSNHPSNNILWTPNLNISNPSLPNPTVSPTTNTSYQVVVTDTLGCSDTDQVNVQVFPEVDLGLANEYFLCPGDSLDLVILHANSVTWNPTVNMNGVNSLTPKFYPPTTSTYFLNYTDTNSCIGQDSILIRVQSIVPVDAGPDQSICEGDTINLGGTPTAPPFSTFNWTGNGIIGASNVSNPSVAPSSSQLYTVLVSNDTCSGSDTVNVTVNPPAKLTVMNDTSICIQDTIFLKAFGNGQFNWENSSFLSNTNVNSPKAWPTNPELFRVTLTNNNGCKAEDSIFVHVQNYPIVNIPDSLFACSYTPFTLGGNPTTSSLNDVRWFPAPPLNSAIVPNPIANIDTSTFFTVQATDSVGCVTYDSTFIGIFSVFLSGDTSICNSDSLILNSISVFGSQPLTYNWSPSQYLNDSSLANPTAVIDTSTNFQLIVTDLKGCDDTANVNVSIKKAALADFSYEVLASCEGIFAEFKNNSKQANFYNWLWDSRNISTKENPDFVFPYGQEIEVTLQAITSENCITEIKKTIKATTLTEVFQFEVPTIFTPNDDGINDYFEVGINQKLTDCINLVVFNRWGTKVYESVGGVHQWDGRTFSGEEADSGTYFYVLELNGVIYKNTVFLAR